MGYITIKDVAQHAGVSTSTVSRFLNNEGRISERTKAEVRAAINALGYIPDSRAQAMRSSKTWTVGLLVPDIRNDYFSNLAYAVQDALFQAGYSTLIGTSSESTERQDVYIRNVVSQHIDGAIIVPQGDRISAMRPILDRKLPLVFVDRTIEGLDGVPTVTADPQPGISAALEDIKANGHRRIAYISGPVIGSPTLQEREQTFRVLAREMFGEENVIVKSSSFEQVSSRIVMARMTSLGATAFMFGYSPDAVRALGEIQSTNEIIGRDLSMVSFDDIDLFKLTSPRISIISQGVEEVGHLGADMFLQLIDGVQPESARIATQYERRESVGPRPERSGR